MNPAWCVALRCGVSFRHSRRQLPRTVILQSSVAAHPAPTPLALPPTGFQERTRANWSGRSVGRSAPYDRSHRPPWPCPLRCLVRSGPVRSGPVRSGPGLLSHHSTPFHFTSPDFISLHLTRREPRSARPGVQLHPPEQKSRGNLSD